MVRIFGALGSLTCHTGAAGGAPPPSPANPAARLQLRRRAVWEERRLPPLLLLTTKPRRLLLALLFVVAVIELHLGHFHSAALAQLQLHVQAPQMPRRVVTQRSTDDWAQQGESGAYYSGGDRTLSFDVCGGFAQQRVALLSGEVPT